MEGLQKKHRQEQKDLQSIITQKKKSATKKTRKGINDECAELEQQLKEKHENELSILNNRETIETSHESAGDVEMPSVVEARLGDVNELMSSSSSPSKQEVHGNSKRPNRQKARLARRAAEQEAAVEQAEKEAANLPNLRDQERESMRTAYTEKGLSEYEIRSDGHCLYAAIADQLLDAKLGLQPKVKLDIVLADSEVSNTACGYRITRQVAAQYIYQNSEDFVPFLEQPLDAYITMIRETGEWGGHLEILALAKAYQADINVLHGNGQVDEIQCGLEVRTPSLWLAYYRHSFGLGEHYNSLRGLH